MELKKGMRNAYIFYVVVMLGFSVFPGLAADYKADFSSKLDDGWSFVREDKSQWRLKDGAVELLAQPSNIWGRKNNKTKNFLLRPFPGKSFSVQVTVERIVQDIQGAEPVSEPASLTVANEPAFPWVFPSPCGLDSVDCDNGTLETDLEAALAAHIVCSREQQPSCSIVDGVHTDTHVCVKEGQQVVDAAVAANTYLLALPAEERADEERLADYLSYALGGTAEAYPLSNETMRDMGYIE